MLKLKLFKKNARNVDVNVKRIFGKERDGINIRGLSSVENAGICTMKGCCIYEKIWNNNKKARTARVQMPREKKSTNMYLERGV